MKKILQDQFLERRTLAQVQTDLVRCKQGPTEKVRSFGNRVERLLMDLNDACIASEGEAASTIIESLNSKTALKAFVDGLNMPIKLLIKASGYKKLADAIEAAIEEETSSGFSGTPKKTLQCNYCHKTGHLVVNCFLKQGSRSRDSYLPSVPHSNIKREPTERVHVIVCNYCKKPGHHINECRKRMFNSNKNDSNARRANGSPGNEHRPGTSSGLTRAGNLQQPATREGKQQ